MIGSCCDKREIERDPHSTDVVDQCCSMYSVWWSIYMPNHSILHDNFKFWLCTELHGIYQQSKDNEH